MPEILFITGLTCEQLGIETPDRRCDTGVEFRNTYYAKDLVLGQKGICTIGSSGMCPAKHTCTRVSITEKDLENHVIKFKPVELDV
jgi:hypothetical protein